MFPAELHSWAEEGNGQLVSGKLIVRQYYIDSGAAFEKVLPVRASEHGNVISLGVHVFKGAVAHGDYFFPKKFEFVSLCSFICLQAVYQLSGPVCKATRNGCPSYSASYSHFTLCD